MIRKIFILSILNILVVLIACFGLKSDKAYFNHNILNSNSKEINNFEKLNNDSNDDEENIQFYFYSSRIIIRPDHHPKYEEYMAGYDQWFNEYWDEKLKKIYGYAADEIYQLDEKHWTRTSFERRKEAQKEYYSLHFTDIVINELSENYNFNIVGYEFAYIDKSVARGTYYAIDISFSKNKEGFNEIKSVIDDIISILDYDYVVEVDIIRSFYDKNNIFEGKNKDV